MLGSFLESLCCRDHVIIDDHQSDGSHGLRQSIYLAVQGRNGSVVKAVCQVDERALDASRDLHKFYEREVLLLMSAIT